MHTHSHKGNNTGNHTPANKSTTLPVVARPDIPGWGSDIDRGKRPAFAMEIEPPEHEGHDAHHRGDAHGREPTRQKQDMEVLVSNERPKRTALFGTGPAPTGISGMIRRFAFKFTENDIRHFMLLLLADRINVVEGIGDDLSRGHVPNVLGEMGIKAELKHNPAGLVRKVAIAGAVTGLAVYMLRRRSR